MKILSAPSFCKIIASMPLSLCFSQSSRSKCSWLMMRTISRAFFGVNFHACHRDHFINDLNLEVFITRNLSLSMTKNLHFFSGRWEGNRHLAAHHHSFFTGLCKFRVISCVTVERTRGKSVEMIRAQKASLSKWFMFHWIFMYLIS